MKAAINKSGITKKIRTLKKLANVRMKDCPNFKSLKGDIMATPTRTAYYVLVDERNEIYLVSNSPDPVAFLTHYFNEFQNSGG